MRGRWHTRWLWALPFCLLVSIASAQSTGSRRRRRELGLVGWRRRRWRQLGLVRRLEVRDRAHRSFLRAQLSSAVARLGGVPLQPVLALPRDRTQLAALPKDKLVALEVVWTPAAENDRMSTDELEAKYPTLTRLTAATGRVFCAHCAGPHAAELTKCPHCGAPAASAVVHG